MFSLKVQIKATTGQILKMLCNFLLWMRNHILATLKSLIHTPWSEGPLNVLVTPWESRDIIQLLLVAAEKDNVLVGNARSLYCQGIASLILRTVQVKKKTMKTKRLSRYTTYRYVQFLNFAFYKIHRSENSESDVRLHGQSDWWSELQEGRLYGHHKRRVSIGLSNSKYSKNMKGKFFSVYAAHKHLDFAA